MQDLDFKATHVITILCLVAVFINLMTSTVIIYAVAQEQERKFTAILNGSSVIPPVSTEASGEAEFKLDVNWAYLAYNVTLKNINPEDTKIIHLHQGAKTENGPLVAEMSNINNQTGIATGNLTWASMKGPLKEKGQTLDKLVDTISKGNLYIEVHVFNQEREVIRGQVSDSQEMQ